MKRLGPELKMPKLKGSEMTVPPFLSDLYYDLRERRLLPIVALILVGIVAAPFLLGGKGSGEPEPVPIPTTGGGATASTADRSLTVVQAEPGLRNYRKRLAHRKPTNPFKQRFDGPALKGAQLNPQTEGGTGSTTVTTTSEGSTSTGETSPGETSPVPSPGGSPTKPELTFFAFALDVRISKSGGGGSASSSGAETNTGTEADAGSPLKSGSASKPASASKSGSTSVVKRRVLPMTPLPGPKAPVVTYLGTADAKKGKALFLVSDQVKSVFGEARCVSGYQICQLLEIDPEFPVTFSYGANDVRYTFKVLKIAPVVTGHG